MNTDDCWLYAGYKNDLGYGQIFYNRKYQYAHRVSYETFVAPIPDRLVIDHLCSVRHCINPEHLEPVTARVNTLRGKGVLINKLKTHCPKGHRLKSGNLVKRKNGWRQCKICHRDRQKAVREYKKLHMNK